jgi:hypothetical protein
VRHHGRRHCHRQLCWERSEAPVVAVAAGQAMPAAPAVQPRSHRAEVIAELECAWASGELEAMVLRFTVTTPPLRPEACAQAPWPALPPGRIRRTPTPRSGY